jgi:hypothetical protein
MIDRRLYWYRYKEILKMKRILLLSNMHGFYMYFKGRLDVTM